MDLIKSLQKIKEIYSEGENMIQFMKKITENETNSAESVMISYDFQAGNSIKVTSSISEYQIECAKKAANSFKEIGDFNSILEVGVGEATTLYRILKELNKNINVYGFDISWSRIKYALKYLKSHKVENANLFTADFCNIPLCDNSIDLVYTWHTLAYSNGKEAEALKELYRVTRKYLFIFEPSYEFGNAETRRHIENHGYVKNLFSDAKEMGYQIIKNELFIPDDPLSANNTGLLLIKKDEKTKSAVNDVFACPLTKAKLELINCNYYSKDSMLLYPIVDGIPCLLTSNAIIATHYLD